ncbi:MAG: hypothetical protein Q4P16_02995 [Spirochaetales bacterium]|nr:hypothetical protein [Spirochaetales bacterium]
MALDGNKTGSAVYKLIKTTKVSDEASCEKLWQKIVTKIFDDIKSDAEITIPSGQVVIAVVGQATGTKNPSPIQSEIE